MKQKIQDFLNNQSYKVKQKIRSEAVRNAKENCIRYGKSSEEYTQDQWMKIVSEEEEKIIEKAWKFGGIGAIAFGFMPWW
tara:strand:+ start:206 stop:445 length:240 start_codon:yes stop_codon:yes gene_type:complete